MSEWGHGDDDETSRLLKAALRREAQRVEVPDRYAEVRAAAGRTEPARRPWLYAVAAALVLVVGAGLIWQLGMFGGRSASMTAGGAAAGQDRAERASAAAPPANPQAPSAAPAGGSTAGSGGARAVNAPAVGFATPSGGIVCYLSGTEVSCRVTSATAWEQTPRTCTVAQGGTATFRYDTGSVTLTPQGATLTCGTPATSGLDQVARDRSTSWYQPGRDVTVTTPYGTIPVLPTGSVATTPNGQRCEVAATAVTCTDPSGAVFSLSPEQVTMSGPSGTNPTVLR